LFVNNIKGDVVYWLHMCIHDEQVNREWLCEMNRLSAWMNSVQNDA
jgi:hypothetical protein